MGFRKPNYTAIYEQLQIARSELYNPRNDGFTQWGIKQDLYLIKEFLDSIIENSSVFVGENEWLTEREKHKVIKILGN